MEQDTGNVVVLTPAVPERASLGPGGKAVREFLAIFFWFYVFIKLFVFDLDVYLATKFLPEYVWLLDLKFFILIGLIAIVWLFTKNKHIGLWFAFIIFYPLILAFGRIPVFLYKQESWILAFALINAIISFFRSIRFIFIGSSFFLVSVAIIISSSSKSLLWLATGIILALLLLAYVHRFVLVFRPSSIFQVHIKLFTGIREHGKKPFFVLDESIKILPVASLDKGQLEKRTSNLSVLFNRTCLFTARKLRDYQNSGLNTISGILTVLLLILLTIVSFAAINYALYKIDPGLFEVSVSQAGFFIFFYYSFNNLLFNSIKEVVPIMPISQAASMAESFLAFFLVVIFVSIILSVRSQRYSEELNQAIDKIEKEGMDMESFIRTEYSVGGIDDAILELEKVKATFISFIFKISKNIK